MHSIRLFKTPDVTVKIYEDTERQIQWRISHEGLYESYVESLLPVESIFEDEAANPKSCDTIDYSNLIAISHLEGRGRTAVVRSSSSPDSICVFKEIESGSFLESRVDFEERKRVRHHEFLLLEDRVKWRNTRIPTCRSSWVLTAPSSFSVRSP